MASKRSAITMTDAEVGAFLDEQKTVTCATNGVGGWPHLMPLWFVKRPSGPGDGIELWAWTFAKSQKTKNLERDPRATLQIEAGTEYHLLRGVMLETDVIVHRDLETVLEVGPIKATAEKTHDVPLPAILGWVLVGGGVVVIALSARSKR